nr:MAG TPA: calcium-binding protein [Caudoviricetes sp.]
MPLPSDRVILAPSTMVIHSHRLGFQVARRYLLA